MLQPTQPILTEYKRKIEFHIKLFIKLLIFSWVNVIKTHGSNLLWQQPASYTQNLSVCSADDEVA